MRRYYIPVEAASKRIYVEQHYAITAVISICALHGTVQVLVVLYQRSQEEDSKPL